MNEFSLKPTTFISKGQIQDIVFDLHRRAYFYIPKSLTLLVEEHQKKHSVNEIKTKYNNKIVNEYFDYLNDNDLILDSKIINNCRNLSLSYNENSFFSNGIIYLNFEKDYSSLMLYYISVFEKSMIKAIEIRIHAFDLCKYIEFTNLLSDTFIHFIHLIILKDDINLDYSEIINKSDKTLAVTVFNCFRTKNLKNEMVRYFNENIDDSKFDVKVMFNKINIKTFSESIQYNLFYNRKIIINTNGDIYRSLDFKEKFGNIRDDNIISTLYNNTKYKKLWKVSKTIIQKCKECEYKHICIDRRVPELKNNKWMYKSDCGYDLNSGEWLLDSSEIL